MSHPVQSDTQKLPADAAIRAANRAAFQELWTRERVRLLGRARGLCGGDAHAAEDLLAQVALNIWTYLETCPKRVDAPGHFLARVMKRLAIDHHRRRAREARLVDHGIDPHDADAHFVASATDPEVRLDHKRRLRRLGTALSSEPAPMQALFRDRFVETLSYREIATRHGVSEVLARKRIQALRRRLKACLDNIGDGNVHTRRTHASDHMRIVRHQSGGPPLISQTGRCNMIIAVCTDDPMVERISSDAAEAHPDTFGNWYKVFDDQIPDLGVNEDLFLVAHGAAFGDENQPVIGSKSNDFYLTARDLNSNLTIFPSGYSGGVYVYACESAQQGAGGLSFVESYQQIIGPSYPNLTAWGQTGKPYGPLPGPEDKSWTRAAQLVS